MHASVFRFGYQEELIGFITARICLLHECNPTDRALLNLNSASLDDQSVLYILTLGVLESVRQQGIGSALLRIVLHEVHYSPQSKTCVALLMIGLCQVHRLGRTSRTAYLIRARED